MIEWHGSMHIDLNCDLGEGAPHDAELMPLITSANIACGAHAGEEETMRRCVNLGRVNGTSIGAHPGYDDREHFGRRELALSTADIRELVGVQVRVLLPLVQQVGMKITHVKPHGALYNQAARDPALATAIARAVHEIDPALILYGLAGSELITAGNAIGLTTAREVFADRRYRPDGSLVPRSQPDALIQNPAEACKQVLRFIHEGRADTVCLHGDGPHAVPFARALRQALAAAGITVKPFSA